MGFLDNALTAVGKASPLIGVATGLAQTVIGGMKARKAQKQLEGMTEPTYGGDKSIGSYYNQALSRFNTSPYASSLYKTQQQNIGRNLNTGLSAMKARGAGAGMASRLVANANDASLNATVAAEQQQNQRFGQLAGATQMKSQDDMRKFQYNQINPFERKFGLLSMKAAANREVANQGLSNMFGAAQNYAMMQSGGGATKPTTPKTKLRQ